MGSAEVSDWVLRTTVACCMWWWVGVLYRVLRWVLCGVCVVWPDVVLYWVVEVRCSVGWCCWVLFEVVWFDAVPGSVVQCDAVLRGVVGCYVG